MGLIRSPSTGATQAHDLLSIMFVDRSAFQAVAAEGRRVVGNEAAYDISSQPCTTPGGGSHAPFFFAASRSGFRAASIAGTIAFALSQTFFHSPSQTSRM